MIVSAIIALATLLASAGVGRQVSRIFALRRRGCETVLFSIALGLGILTLVMFAAGLFGLFTPLFARVLLAAALIVTAPCWLAALADLWTLARRFIAARTALARFFMAALALAAVVNFTCSLAPPTETDALTMHL